MQGNLKWATLSWFIQWYIIYFIVEEFGASSEKKSCDKNCPEPCEHVEYETSFSYSALQPESFIDHLMDFLKSNDTSVDRAIYEPLLNMTPSERERYIEWVLYYLDWYLQLNEEICELMYTKLPLWKRERANKQTNKQTKKLVVLQSDPANKCKLTDYKMKQEKNRSVLCALFAIHRSLLSLQSQILLAEGGYLISRNKWR